MDVEIICLFAALRRVNPFGSLAPDHAMLVCWFCCFTSQVNSYGHGGTISSPNHTFSWAGLNKRLTSNSCTYFRLLMFSIIQHKYGYGFGIDVFESLPALPLLCLGLAVSFHCGISWHWGYKFFLCLSDLSMI